MRNILLSILLVSILFACARTADIKSVAMPVETPQQTILPKISKDVDFLSADDAVKVANLFNHGTVLTKSETLKEIKDVVPIKDDSGCTLIYAVNYTDGYDLISATKKYYPVLAMVEHGTYTGEQTNTGYDVIMNEYVEATQAAIDGKITIDRNQWAVYEEVPYNAPVQTKVSDAYTEVLDRYMEDWYMAGYNFYRLNMKPENMPDEMYETFCDYARDYDRPDHDYMYCSFIVENNHDFRIEEGPFCQTIWGQNLGYNDDVPGCLDLGCSTVAIGQIMKCLDHPDSINWNGITNMLPVGGNNTLTNFLAGLRKNIGVSNNGNASISQVKNALESSYGYVPNQGFRISIINHNSAQVEQSLIRKVPVYMRGTNPSTTIGHAWVCDGYYTTHAQTEFYLYVIPFGAGEITELTNICTDRVYPENFVIHNYYHMNWGHFGNNNGYFYKEALWGNFSTDRKDLIIARVPNDEESIM